MSQDKSNAHYIPAAALKRFADDLSHESTSSNNKFLQINRDRVSTFIDKPYLDPRQFGAKVVHKDKPKTRVPGINEYNFHNEETQSFVHLQNSSAFQPTLGARSRFGDGDGSFFDRWLNSDALTSDKARDKDGLPVMKFSLNHNQTGFKKAIQDYREDRQAVSGVSQVRPYAERRAERLKAEKEKSSSIQAAAALLTGSCTSPDLKRSAAQLPAVTALSAAERENYFGFEARSTFFEYYRQLNRQQMNADPVLSPRNTSAPDDDYQTLDIPELPEGLSSSRPTIDERKVQEPTVQRFAPKVHEQRTESPGTQTRSRPSSRSSDPHIDVFRETYSRMRPRGSAPSEEEKRQLLDHLFAIDPLEQRDARPSSARTRYLQGCVQQNKLPRPGLIIRKDFTTFLNLTSFGMGNDLAVILADALDSVPLLEGLSIADNGLDDRGLVPIVGKLSQCRNLRTFDLSNNKVDSHTAEALRRFISSEDCALTVLRMQNANVDDNEAFRFMETIAARNTIQELDLSHNLLGSHEVAVRRSAITAGESIGRLLRTANCSLVSLTLAWNTIRYHSGIVLVEALKVNSTLTLLDLSYNGLGIDGGEALGNALNDNKCLRVLKIAHNNITPRPCFTIFSGIKTCESLTEVDMSGNPIGEDGARGLLTLNITYGYRVKVDIKNCSVRIKDNTCWFNALEPMGDYTLDLSKAYERAVCMELLRTVARDQDLSFTKFKIHLTEADAEAGVGGVEINPQIATRAITSSTVSDGNEGMLNITTEGARELFRETADRIFQQYDADESGSLDRDELTFILEQLGLQGAWQWVDKLLSIYDTDNSGRVEEDEFISFLLDVKSSYENELNWTSKMKFIYDANSNGQQATSEPYLPPEQGFARIEIDAHQTANKFVQILSSKQVESLLIASKAVPDGSALIELALSSNKWTINEAQAFFQAMLQENGSVLQVLLKVLPHMAGPLDARMLIAYVTNHQFEQIQALKILLGPLYRVYIGIPNGFYHLNLADERDRDAFTRLAALSLLHADKRRTDEQGDTSQDGTYQSFRNTYFDNRRVVFTDEWLRSIPEKGHVEFDFVLLAKVPMTEAEISNLRLFRLLNTLGVLDDTKRSRVFSKLAQNKAEGRAAAKGSGLKRWDLSSFGAKEIASYLKFLYDSCTVEADGQPSSNRQPRAYHIDVSKEETSMLEGKRRLRRLAAMAASTTATAPLTGGGLGRTGSKRAANGSSLLRRNSRRDSVNSVGSMESNDPVHTEVGGRASMYQSVEDIMINQDKLFKIPENPVNEAELGEVTTMDIYGHHVKEMLENVMMERELIAIRILDALETVLAGRYLTCAQVGLIVERFPFGNVKHSDFGSFRVELIVSLFSRITDIINFEYVLKELDNVEIAMVIFRLGWLNVWNPLKPEGNICLDLSRREERQVARMLITLKYVETGETWQEQSFRPSLTAPMPEDNTWKLPIGWYAESTLPNAGILSLMYFSGKGIQLQGCEPNIASRVSLMALVLAQPFAEDVWHSSDSVVNKAESLVQRLGFRLSFIAEKQAALLANAKEFLEEEFGDIPDTASDNTGEDADAPTAST